MERFAPSYVGKGGFAQAMRLGGFIGLAGGFIYFYQRSCCTASPLCDCVPRDHLYAIAANALFDKLTPCLSFLVRFYGMSENVREVDMDMREMVAKVKAGETLYGESRLSTNMQGVAARQSRYSALFMHVVPWFNFVSHNQHGVDTAKYYQQAERELEAERAGK